MDQAEIGEYKMVCTFDLVELYDKNKGRGFKVRRCVFLA